MFNPLKLYREMVPEINEIRLESLSDGDLLELSGDLYHEAESVPTASLRTRAYALVKEAVRRVLGIHLFDEQLMAAIAMDHGRLIEMQTGEGKTLAAVLPAYLNALTGEGVHILTFNDYLARRDAEWMGPVYRFLGVSVGFIREGMSVYDRQQAYTADVTYVTAKEAGFDYLRGFLCDSMEQLVHRPFHFAIVDEADSIMIDEARIPLVIAGRISEQGESLIRVANIMKDLKPELHYGLDEYARNVFFTEEGLDYVEKALDCDNLYTEGNVRLLAAVSHGLHAQVLLKKDVDYIVRSGKVQLVDELTGRVAENRHWPDGLHEAVEAKEGVLSEAKGQILDSITLQSFLGLYPKITGMTGTAKTAASDFKEFYGIEVVSIPTHQPCIRADHADVIFTHKEAKNKALVAEITKVHACGRPILVGTGSVEESEQLAAALMQQGVSCRVLNAKNDALEAKIISEAGMLGAVTVSTNMAGRGVDIRLGGESGLHRERIVALGGLYVIGSNKYESRRIDDQLRGRAGRQGDPGETRFFVSLEDDLMVRYRLKDLIPPKLYPQNQNSPLVHPVIRREVSRAQRIIEGQNFDIRRMLLKYSHNLEKQRKSIHKMHEEVLNGTADLQLLQKRVPEGYREKHLEVGEEALKRAERQITLYQINRCWAEFLEYVAYIQDSIHLVNIGKKNPIDEFNRMIIGAFEKLVVDIEQEIVNTFQKVKITKDGIEAGEEVIQSPTATWTYLVSDGAEQFHRRRKGV